MDTDDKRKLALVEGSPFGARWEVLGARYVHREDPSQRGCPRRESVQAQVLLPRVVGAAEWDVFSHSLLRSVGLRS